MPVYNALSLVGQIFLMAACTENSILQETSSPTKCCPSRVEMYTFEHCVDLEFTKIEVLSCFENLSECLI